MVASAVFLLDAKGKVLISRNYRGDIPVRAPPTRSESLVPQMSAIEKFMPLIMEKEEDGEVPTPVLTSEDGIHFLYVLHNGVYFVAMTKRNSNAAAIFAFLHKLINVGRQSVVVVLLTRCRSLSSISRSSRKNPSGTTLSLSTSCWTR